MLQTESTTSIFKFKQFWSLWWHFFARVFSVAAILLFVLSNVFQSELWKINQASAIADGVGAKLTPSNNGTSWSIVVSYNGQAGSFKVGDNVSANFKVFHCKKANDDICIANGSADYKGETASQTVGFTVPATNAGDVSIGTYGSAGVNCGRLQADLGVPDKDVFGGAKWKLGADCPDDAPPPGGNPPPGGGNPPAPVNPCPNGPAEAPNLPRNLKANSQPTGHVFPAGTNKFNLTWEAPASGNAADKYAVRFDNPNTPGTDIALETTSLSYEITLQTPDPIKYGWWVHAGNQCGFGQPAGAELTISGPQAPPDNCPALGSPINLNPHLVQLDAGTRSRDFSWAGVAGATSYDVVVRSASGQTLYSQNVTGTTVNVSGLQDGMAYTWSVTPRAAATCPAGATANGNFNVRSPQGGGGPTPACISLSANPSQGIMGQNITLTPNISNAGNLGSVKLRFYTAANSNLSDQGWFDIATVTPNQPYTWNIAETEVGNHFFDMVLYDQSNNPIDWWRNSQCRAAVYINAPSSVGNPSCSISPNNNPILVNSQVGFNVTYNPNGSNRTPTQYSYNFGDGQSLNNGNFVSHTYNTQGTYPVSVTLSDNTGTLTSCSTSVVVNPQNQGPLSCSIQANNPTTGQAPLSVSFGATVQVPSNRSLSSYQWDLNSDGVVDSTNNTASFTYNTSGNYTARLRVTDNGGGEAFCTLPIIVIPSGGPANLTVKKYVVYNGTEYDDTLAASVKRFGPNETVTYRIKVMNNSGVNATNVQVIDNLPPHLNPASVQGGNISGKTITWTVGSIPANSTHTIDYTATVVGTIPAGDTSQSNRADLTINGNTAGSDLATVIVGRAAQGGEPVINIEKSVSPQSINVGNPASFTIKIKNNSGRTVTGIQVIDDLPPGFSYISGSTSGSTSDNPSISGQTLTWSNISLNDQQEWTVTFRVNTPNSTGNHTNSARGKVTTEGDKPFGPVQATLTITQPNNPSLVGIQPQYIVPINPTYPQVLGLQVLPKTGLPMLAWAAAAFVPLGLKMRRFAQWSTSTEDESQPHYIAEKRKFNGLKSFSNENK